MVPLWISQHASQHVRKAYALRSFKQAGWIACLHGPEALHVDCVESFVDGFTFSIEGIALDGILEQAQLAYPHAP